MNNQTFSKDDNTKIEQKLGLLETQMNAKILQMQNKKAKLFKLKKNHDFLGMITGSCIMDRFEFIFIF